MNATEHRAAWVAAEEHRRRLREHIAAVGQMLGRELSPAECQVVGATMAVCDQRTGRMPPSTEMVQ